MIATDSYVSLAHHHIEQRIRGDGQWRTVKVEGQSLVRSPFTGRAVIGAQLLGRMDLRATDVTLRILRVDAPASDNGTGWDDLPIRRHWARSYVWTGHVAEAAGYAVQLRAEGGDVVILNAALKLDRLGA